MDTSDTRVRPGTMCAILAAGESHGILRPQICVEFIWFLSGRLMTNTLSTIQMSLTE